MKLNIRHMTARDYEVSTIYFGGGTPSTLKAQVIDSILQEIYKYLHVKKMRKLRLSAIRERSREKKLALYRLSGINRLSFGLQSANNQELKMLGGIHSYEDFLESYDAARKADLKIST